MFVLGLVAYNKQKNHLRKGLSQTPVPLWHLRSPRRVKQVTLSSPSLNVYVCGVHMQMCVCVWAYACTSVCRLEAMLEVSVTLYSLRQSQPLN